MNLSVNYYNDDLDGDHLACKPGAVAVGLETLCSLAIPVTGWVHVGLSLWTFGLAHREGTRRQLLAKYSQETGQPTSFTRKSRHKGAPVQDSTSFSHKERVLYTLAFTLMCQAGMWLTYGWGTKYPTTHIMGQLGDLFGKFHVCLSTVLRNIHACISICVSTRSNEYTECYYYHPISFWLVWLIAIHLTSPVSRCDPLQRLPPTARSNDDTHGEACKRTSCTLAFDCARCDTKLVCAGGRICDVDACTHRSILSWLVHFLNLDLAWNQWVTQLPCHRHETLRYSDTRCPAAQRHPREPRGALQTPKYFV
jgi:hypothetical protein